MSIPIRTENMTKRFGEFVAVDNVSISVNQGEIYGFLGLNGAGKTTTIRMLLGMVRPTSGSASFFGETTAPGKPGPWEKIGYLVEMPYSYPELTVRENLDVVRRLRRIKKNNAVDETMEQLHLGEYADVKAKNLSLGNNQRLGLGKALLHQPEILILDEPSNGLDPSGIVEIRELLREMAFNKGVTTFISSHNLGEISRIATRIGIIHQGKLIQEMDTDKLGSVLIKKLIINTRDNMKAAQVIAQMGYRVEPTENGTINILEPDALEKPEKVNQRLVEAGLPPHLLMTEQEDLESYFLRTIGAAT